MKICYLLCVLALSGCDPKKPEPTATKPADGKVIATVLDQQITENDHKRLQGLIFGQLFEKFAKDNQIEATEEEIETFNRWMDKSQRNSIAEWEKDRTKLVEELEFSLLDEDERKSVKDRLGTLNELLRMQPEMDDSKLNASEQEKKEIQQGARRIAQEFIRRSKTNKAFFEKYGGRVLFQQAGPEPIDAYRDYLKEMQKKGVWKILEKKHEDEFWRYFLEQPEYLLSSEEDSQEIFETPLWEMDIESTEE